METDFFMNPISADSYSLINQLKIVLDKFEDKVKFTPYYIFKDLRDIYTDSVLKNKCYYLGEYCVIEETPFSFV